MKKHIIFIIAFVLIAVSAQAQIDRSKMPKSGPTPVIKLGEPYTFKMGNGLTVLVVENKKLPRITVSLSLDNPPNAEGNKAGIEAIASEMMGKGTKNISKDVFNEEVDFLGAFVNVGASGGFAQSLSKYSDRIIELFADASLNPNFTQEELDLEKKKLIEGIKSGENSAEAVASRVRSVLAYGKNHPAGEYTTEKTVNNITLADVETYYRKNFVPSNAYMVISGDISNDKAKELVEKHFTSWTSGKAPSFGIPDVKDAQYRQINFIDMPNAVQTEMAVMNISDLKMADEDHHAALVTNYILGGSFGSYVNMNLREEHGYTYGARSTMPRNKNFKTAFRVTAKVRNMVTDSAVVETLKEIKRIRTEDVDEEVLKNAKAKFLGNFILASENDRTIASRSIDIKTQNLPKDFYETFIAKINAVSKDDIKRIANKYFNLDKARIVLVGKGSDVLENLEKIQFEGKKIPILYFDKYGNKAEKPEYNAAIPEGVTAQSVFDTYFKAIGGKDKLEAVTSTFTSAQASMGGATLDMTLKTTSKNQMLTNILFGGNSVSKNVFDGTKGYAMAQGQKIDFTEAQIADTKKSSYPFPELKSKDATLEGIEPYENGKAYKLKMSDKKTSFFDTETGLKIKDIVIQEQGGQKVSSTISYSNYKEVNGIKFPHTISIAAGPQKFDFNVSSVKINEGVTDEDFK
ncbi:M16 family metallopeptidase [Aquimarina litoralis]|uniref:M16 family metallopeptidase n=1 Tax=Aquimarina litoralis TaxID=584605 RepID=UPI001C56B0F3|nr:pitrilysin family protein [Aquimarina litoralis]MBW1295244.1 insulinase family protein [Aquimarina litoralis]